MWTKTIGTLKRWFYILICQENISDVFLFFFILEPTKYDQYYPYSMQFKALKENFFLYGLIFVMQLLSWKLEAKLVKNIFQ